MNFLAVLSIATLTVIVSSSSVYAQTYEQLQNHPYDELLHEQKQPLQKHVILTFDDNYESQYTVALPILQKYGFNATFFVYCNGIVDRPTIDKFNQSLMSRQQLEDVIEKGYDVEAHSISHMNLEDASAKELAYEIDKADDCIEQKLPGLDNITVYATPGATGTHNATVLEAIKDAGYDFARAGYSDHFNLKCDDPHYVPSNQTAGCALYEDNGTMKVQNRYNIPTSNINGISRENGHGINDTVNDFVRMLRDHVTFDDTDNQISIPVLVYHAFNETAAPVNVKGPVMITEMFTRMMDYLHKNNYTVLSMRDLKYNNQTNEFTLPE
jgi:Polysaccharide deacetylase